MSFEECAEVKGKLGHALLIGPLGILVSLIIYVRFLQ